MAGIRKREWVTSKGIKKTCYEITYYLDGKQYRKSGFKTKIEAQNKLQEVTNTITSDITFKKLVEEYISSREYRCKESTRERYLRYLKCNLKYLHNKKAKKVTKRDIEQIVILLKEQKIANKTINCIILFLRSVYNYGISNKWLSENPAKLTETLPNSQKKDKDFLTEQEMQKYIQYIKDYPINKQAPLLTALLTGMRIGELLALEWNDIDFKTKQISINKQVLNNKISTPKTDSSIRKVDMSDMVIDSLIKLKKEQKVLSHIVFCNKCGGYMKRNAFIKNWFKPIMAKLGKADYTFHSLRHTYTSYLLSNGVPVKYVQEQLGHSSASTTLEIYNHILPNIRNIAINLFDNLKYEHNVSMA